MSLGGRPLDLAEMNFTQFADEKVVGFLDLPAGRACRLDRFKKAGKTAPSSAIIVSAIHSDALRGPSLRRVT